MVCPILCDIMCVPCAGPRDQAHTLKYCPLNGGSSLSIAAVGATQPAARSALKTVRYPPAAAPTLPGSSPPKPLDSPHLWTLPARYWSV